LLRRLAGALRPPSERLGAAGGDQRRCALTGAPAGAQAGWGFEGEKPGRDGRSARQACDSRRCDKVDRLLPRTQDAPPRIGC